ncbi:unnamed protein product [Lepeophtheirus salmonis]|uniref:Sulfhydryl oxidase n=1 Tax=Lepeophtheirus salmonis TaxID=72036 RepID=A0A7R8GZK2_LEPSM|nr:unnamed protein product [Lepeophtheirus salmonis]CAF2766140.1 unnamed protein product [Lepeophtheirus salmonis]
MGLESGWNCHISLKSQNKLDTVNKIVSYLGPKYPRKRKSESSIKMFRQTILGSSIPEDLSRPSWFLDFPQWKEGAPSVSEDEQHQFHLHTSHSTDAYSVHSDSSNPFDYDMSNRAKLPQGIENIRPHLKNMDDVPLLVSLFTDCTPATTTEMLVIMQEYGEVVCVLGSSSNHTNASIFLQADGSLGVEPLYPQICQSVPVFTPPKSGGMGPIELAGFLNSIVCSLSFKRKDEVSIFHLLLESRHFVLSFINTMQFWISSILALSSLHLFCIPPQFTFCIDLSCMGVPPDASIMNISTGKNILCIDIKYGLWCYGLRFIPSLLLITIIHGLASSHLEGKMHLFQELNMIGLQVYLALISHSYLFRSYQTWQRFYCRTCLPIVLLINEIVKRQEIKINVRYQKLARLEFGCILLTTGEEGLYGPNDKVVLLDSTNFVSKVHGSKTAWMIEFYSSWCGHCINFAPTFKNFSAKVHDWSNVIQIGVLDCADDKNTNTCRNYEVNGYPTLKFFPPNSLNTSKGIERASYQKSIRSLMKDTASFAASQKELSSIFRSVEFGHETSVFESNPNAKLGIPLFLSSSDTSILASVLKKGESKLSSLEIKGNDVLQDVEIVMKKVQTLNLKNEGKGKSPQITTQMNDDDVKRRRYTVYMSDLENALLYSLKHEVATHSIISGVKLSVLQEYIDILSKYYPGRKVARHFIKELQAWIAGLSDVKGSDLENHIIVLSKQLGAFSDTPKDWQGCKGSSKRYGGYPCSLWTLFHALSVNHAGVTSDKKSTKLDVLKSMRGYIKEFFGCRECARNFELEWLSDDPSKMVSNVDDAIIWLWKTHNKVNIRLINAMPDNGSKTGDNLTHEFNMTHVLEFLKTLYGGDIDFKGLSKELYVDKVFSGSPGSFIHSKNGELYDRTSTKGWFSAALKRYFSRGNAKYLFLKGSVDVVTNELLL